MNRRPDLRDRASLSPFLRKHYTAFLFSVRFQFSDVNRPIVRQMKAIQGYDSISKFRFLSVRSHHNPLDVKGTQTQEKNELLAQFGIDYNALPIIFRMGSSVFRDKDEPTGNDRVVVEHCNIIEMSFWKEHPRILDEEEPLPTILRPHSNKMLRLS